jgi:thiamine biosynthesis lipoprotein
MREPFTFPALGTTAALVVNDARSFETARVVFAAEIDAIDAACSRFRDDSELARVNANGGQATTVSALFAEALAVSLRAARLTDGRVDPTVGSAMRVLGYDRSFDDLDRHGPALTVSVRRVPGWRIIEFDREHSTVRIPEGVELDFGATAKALCADRAARNIAAVIGTGVLVGLGGDIAVAGTPPDAGWTVLIAEDHAAGHESADQGIIVRSGGVATSGTTVRRWLRGDRDVHHVIDPESGHPAAECWRTATVAAASCVDANIASTAAIVLGPDAPGWLEARHLPARLVAGDGSVVRVAGWPSETEVAC